MAILKTLLLVAQILSALGVIGLVLLAIGFPLTFVLIGFPIMWLSHLIHVLTVIWFVVRCVVGLVAAANDQAYARPRAWLGWPSGGAAPPPALPAALAKF